MLLFKPAMLTLSDVVHSPTTVVLVPRRSGTRLDTRLVAFGAFAGYAGVRMTQRWFKTRRFEQRNPPSFISRISETSGQDQTGTRKPTRLKWMSPIPIRKLIGNHLPIDSQPPGKQEFAALFLDNEIAGFRSYKLMMKWMNNQRLLFSKHFCSMDGYQISGMYGIELHIVTFIVEFLWHKLVAKYPSWN